MESKQRQFIIVDDDPISNIICKTVITNAISNAEVITFTKPEEGLAYLKSVFASPGIGKATLLLDINMPTMTGWEFMEQFEQFEPIVKNLLSVYILSSSVNPTDREKANANQNIINYIEKPLSMEGMQSLV